MKSLHILLVIVIVVAIAVWVLLRGKLSLFLRPTSYKAVVYWDESGDRARIFQRTALGIFHRDRIDYVPINVFAVSINSSSTDIIARSFEGIPVCIDCDMYIRIRQEDRCLLSVAEMMKGHRSLEEFVHETYGSQLADSLRACIGSYDAQSLLTDVAKWTGAYEAECGALLQDFSVEKVGLNSIRQGNLMDKFSRHPSQALFTVSLVEGSGDSGIAVSTVDSGLAVAFRCKDVVTVGDKVIVTGYVGGIYTVIPFLAGCDKME